MSVLSQYVLYSLSFRYAPWEPSHLGCRSLVIELTSAAVAFFGLHLNSSFFEPPRSKWKGINMV